MTGDPPKVSVVLSVLDRPMDVLLTVQSVLAQQDVELELMIVADGATAGVMQVLQVYAKDERVRVIKQDNAGLTRALIRGCKHAAHPFIARIDAGDTMVSGRLAKQAEVLINDERVGVVATWVAMATVEGYHLYDVNYTAQELQDGVGATKAQQLKTPAHSSVMFRKSFYNQVGGYRRHFYVAQDADLWSRMTEVSTIRVVSQVLTRAVFSASGISGRHAQLQQQMAELIVRAAKLRRKGKSEKAILKKAVALKPSRFPPAAEINNARVQANYFLASVLSAARSPHAKEYWWRVIRIKPWYPKAWVRGLLSLVYR